MPYTYAGWWGEGFTDQWGNARRGASVSVYLRGTSTLATLYTDETKAITAANPFTTDSRGNGSFFAAPGDYDLTVTVGGTELVSLASPIEVTVPPHPDEVEGSVLAWAAGEAYEFTSVTYTGGIPTSAVVKWPDGSAGVFTATTTNSTWQAVDAYTITHVDLGVTVTQAAVTRDSNGNVTVKPALTIA